jgi:hypothetical protein
MRRWVVVVVGMVFLILVGCGGEEAAPAVEEGGVGESYTSAALDVSYEGALPVISQLALGTLKLEGTEEAVASGQATALLPLWQALQGGVTAQVEVEAVLAQIEATMSQEQIQAIAAMELTQDDMAAWMEQNGIALPALGEGDGSGGQGFGPGQGLSEEEREAMRATVEAGGGFGGFGGGMGGMSEEDRAAARATMEASGAVPPGGFGGGRMRGGANLFIPPLVELLTERAAE